MKMKVKHSTYEKVMSLPKARHRKPIRPNIFWRVLIRLLSQVALMSSRFTYQKHGMEKVSAKEPVLILMNHSSFVDMEIASRVLFPRAYGIVCTSDAFVGMEWLMRLIGCFPTQKFVSDLSLVQDMQ